MKKMFFVERVLDASDWVTAVFFLIFVLIVINKYNFPDKFKEYLLLLLTNRYIKIYDDTRNLFTGFTIILLLVSLLSFSLFGVLVAALFFDKNQYDWSLFLKIASGLTLFFIVKLGITAIFGRLFKHKTFFSQFNLLKINYITYYSFVLLPLLLLGYYTSYLAVWSFYFSFFFYSILLFYIYIITIKHYQSVIKRHLFYFILYLCTLEIAPYYFVYYWITKN